MQTLTVLIVVGALLSACAQGERKAASREPPQEYQNVFLAYRDCVAEGTGQLVESKATPYQIADAALAGCGRQAVVYKKVVRDYYISLVSRGSLSMALERADTKVAETREMLRGMAIRRVVESRISK